MNSKSENEAFVWIWLPGHTKPVVAGRLEVDGANIQFNYGKSYLARVLGDNPAISIYEPELPLIPGRLPLPRGLNIPGCIRDAAPDAWGRRVILNKKSGARNRGADTTELNEITYLLESGSDRIGALDFQRSSAVYEARSGDNPTIEELNDSAKRVEDGIPLSPELDQALLHGSSIGGARPKALIQDLDKKFIAKFSLATDLFSYVKTEFIAMRLAALAGLNTAPVKLTKAANKDVLLVERFDRVPKDEEWSRRIMVSAQTMLSLDEMMARYASYEIFAAIIRQRFTNPRETLKELFSRLVFNILCGNTDDHARNHAAFWDGKNLTLTPAYDICPQSRAGNEASQAMLISGNNNLSQLKSCLETAHNFLLSEKDAHCVFDKITCAIETHWDAVCDEAALSEVEKNSLWGRQFLNKFSIER